MKREVSKGKIPITIMYFKNTPNGNRSFVDTNVLLYNTVCVWDDARFPITHPQPGYRGWLSRENCRNHSKGHYLD